MAAKKAAVATKKQLKVVKRSKKDKTLTITRGKQQALSVKKKTKLVGFRPNYDEIFDSVEKKFKLTSNMTERMKYALSSGNLVQDLVLGGGLLGGGMYTWAGGEQSAKSTDIMNFLASLLLMEVRPPLIAYFDPEGSFDPVYFSSMLGKEAKKHPHIFGVKAKNGGYTVAPEIRYYPESRGEQVMDALNNLLKKLPDKELLDGVWYYVYENTKDNRKLVGDKYSKQLFSKYNKFYVEAPDGGMAQLVIAMDSWVSLIPEKLDDEDAGTGLAVLGRFFSENLPKIKGKLRRKNAILLGVNQLREKPMVQGDPRYEPGGQALRFQSDVRIWNTGRSVPHGTGPTEEEPSIFGKGTDLYRYVHIQAKKNKLATPFMQGWMRLWVKDRKGKGHGIDKVWDAFQYLKMTGQISGARSNKKPSLLIKFADGGPSLKLTWLDFKILVLGDRDMRKKVLKTLKYKGKPFSMYSLCKKQMASGKGTALYYDNLGNLDEDDED